MDRLASLNDDSSQVYESEEYLESVPVKEEPVSEDDVPADIPLECMLCAKKLLTATGLKAHVIAQHNYKSVKRKSGDCPSPDNSAAKQQKHVCDVCRRSFVTSTDLKVHETCHDKFCCFACNAKFNSFKEVTRHRRRCKNKDQGTVTKPKTLTDILRERKLQKNADKLVKDSKQLVVHCLRCTDACFHDMSGYKIHKVLKHGETDAFGESEKKIEIEIANVVSIAQDVKTSLNIEKENNEVIKNIKSEVDYAKIETELQSIFDIAIEKRQLQVTILENETNGSPNIKDKEEINEKNENKTVEEILSQETKTQESKSNRLDLSQKSKTDESNRLEVKIEQQEVDCHEKIKQCFNSSNNTLETNTLIESESSLSNKEKSDTPCPQNKDVNAFNLKCDSNNELDKVELLKLIDTIENTEAINELFDIKVAECDINQKSEAKESVDIQPIESNSKQSNEEIGEQYNNESRDTNELFDIKVAEYDINQKSEAQESVDIQPIESYSKKSNEEIGEQYNNESRDTNELFDIKVAEYDINQKSEAKESVDIQPIESSSKKCNDEIGEQYKNDCSNISEDQIQNKTDEEIKELNKDNKINSEETIDEVQNQENVTNCKETKVENQLQDNQDESNGTEPIEKTVSQDETTNMEACYKPEDEVKQNEEKYTKSNDDFEEVDKNNETDTIKTNKVEIQDRENEKFDFNVDSDVTSENTVNIQAVVDRISPENVEQNALVKTLNDCEQNGAHVEENEDKLEESKLSVIPSNW